MNGFSGFGNSPAKELKDLRGTKEKGKKVDLTVKPNPTTKAVKNKDYKIDEKEEQVIENMSNASNFDGHIEMQINKLKKPKKKHPLGIEDPAELKKLYEKTENPNNKRRQ